jgi:hypothetical protein
MNRFFGELPTSLQRSSLVESLNQARVALIFATGETRVAKLEICPITDSRNVALSARLEKPGDNPRDGLLQYLTQEGVDAIHASSDPTAGTILCLSLAAA